MRYPKGTVPLVLGVLAGVGGLYLSTLEVCTFVFELSGACLASERLYQTPGLIVMIFGGILFVVGVVLMTTGGRETPPPSPHSPAGRYCPDCGTPNSLEAQYCLSCGIELPAG